jgi:YegS/Rv2252/BmrU family lipid kinase
MKVLRESIVHCFRSEFQVEIRKSTLENSFQKLTTNAINKGVDYLILVGGDGSVNEGVNGYFDANQELRKKIILGVYPAGSGNDFSKSLGVGNDLEQLLFLVKNDSFKKIDVGLMHFNNVDNTPGKRYFINIADIGIGGYVANKISDSKKRLGGEFTYTKALIQSFFRYKKQKVQLTSKDYNWTGKMLSICMANGKYFGSGMCIAPDAKLSDGKMQLVVIGEVSLYDYLKNIPKIKKGHKVIHTEVKYASAEKCEITAIDNPCPIDMDGEYIGTTPLKIEVLSNQLKMLLIH